MNHKLSLTFLLVLQGPTMMMMAQLDDCLLGKLKNVEDWVREEKDHSKNVLTMRILVAEV
jgi:hypothetical protein